MKAWLIRLRVKTYDKSLKKPIPRATRDIMGNLHVAEVLKSIYGNLISC